MQQGTGRNDRFDSAHNDMWGQIQSAQTGGTAWSIEAITGTTQIVGALRNNSSDIVQTTIQVPHSRKLNTNLDSIHIHYVLQAASNLNDTIVFTGKYCWIQPGDIIPASISWTAMSGAGLTLNLGAAKSVRYYGVHSIETNIPCPASPNEGYGGILLIEITRGNGTYAGNFGILYIDAHTPIDRAGSYNEISD